MGMMLSIECDRLVWMDRFRPAASVVSGENWPVLGSKIPEDPSFASDDPLFELSEEELEGGKLVLVVVVSVDVDVDVSVDVDVEVSVEAVVVVLLSTLVVVVVSEEADASVEFDRDVELDTVEQL